MWVFYLGASPEKRDFKNIEEEDGRRRPANGVLEMRLSPRRIDNGFEVAHSGKIPVLPFESVTSCKLHDLGFVHQDRLRNCRLQIHVVGFSACEVHAAGFAVSSLRDGYFMGHSAWNGDSYYPVHRSSGTLGSHVIAIHVYVIAFYVRLYCDACIAG